MAADIVQTRREANRDRDAEETIQTWARQEMEFDLKKREKERKRIKPVEDRQVLGEIDRFWEDINTALNYKPRNPGESIIDRDWGEAMIKSLNELRDQIRFEGSFPTLVFDKEEFETRQRAKWLEPKWKKMIEALRVTLRNSGEEYTETPAEDKQRRARRDRAVSEYLAGVE